MDLIPTSSLPSPSKNQTSAKSSPTTPITAGGGGFTPKVPLNSGATIKPSKNTPKVSRRNTSTVASTPPKKSWLNTPPTQRAAGPTASTNFLLNSIQAISESTRELNGSGVDKPRMFYYNPKPDPKVLPHRAYFRIFFTSG